jgi:hypothetical protein
MRKRKVTLYLKCSVCGFEFTATKNNDGTWRKIVGVMEITQKCQKLSGVEQDAVGPDAYFCEELSKALQIALKS